MPKESNIRLIQVEGIPNGVNVGVYHYPSRNTKGQGHSGYVLQLYRKSTSASHYTISACLNPYTMQVPTQLSNIAASLVCNELNVVT